MSNLLRRKLVRKHHSPRAMVWYIAKENNEIAYHVTEIDRNSGAVKWTPTRSQAIQFHTEAGVQHFIHAHLTGRTDIYAIHAPEEKR